MKREDVLQREILPDAGSPTTTEASEKRQHARVPVSIGVEIVDTRTHVRITGRATDFGVGGCYVDTMSTFAEGTPVDVFLHWHGRTLQMRALVSYVVNGRSIGMGLSFTGSSAEAGATLLDWVTGSSSRSPQKSSPRAEPKTGSTSEVEPIRGQGLENTIGELLALLVHKRVLTETEGAQLRDKISR